jgi:sulfofructose kinase
MFRIDGTPERGSKAAASHFDEICGGNALNAAIGIARLGGHAALARPIGDGQETSNKFILERLAHEGIDATGLVHMPGLVTAISAIMIDRSGERTNVTFRDAQLWQVRLPDTDKLQKDCDAAPLRIRRRCAEMHPVRRCAGLPGAGRGRSTFEPRRRRTGCQVRVTDLI